MVQRHLGYKDTGGGVLMGCHGVFWCGLGLFTVAIFGSFLASFLDVWQKNDQNELKNDYCERSEMQT
jgi:hypothetical protein